MQLSTCFRGISTWIMGVLNLALRPLPVPSYSPISDAAIKPCQHTTNRCSEIGRRERKGAGGYKTKGRGGEKYEYLLPTQRPLHAAAAPRPLVLRRRHRWPLPLSRGCRLQERRRRWAQEVGVIVLSGQWKDACFSHGLYGPLRLVWVYVARTTKPRPAAFMSSPSCLKKKKSSPSNSRRN